MPLHTGGVAGFGKGEAKVTLEDTDGTTILTYEAEAKIGGKLAQIGSRLIKGATKKMADEFFVNFAEALGASSEPMEIDAETEEA